MSRLAKALFVAAAAAMSIAGPGAMAAEPELSNKIVVELFTSQGCSSCPPADALLGELAKRDDVIALSMHVDYWNYIGWADPFATRESTQRQRAYKSMFRKGYVYTPQIVVAGRSETVGSDGPGVNRLIGLAAAAPHAVAISISRPRDGIAEVHIAALPGAARGGRTATVWLALYDSRHETTIGAGENSGTTIVNVNVVRTIKKVGVWRGGDTDVTVPLEALGSKGRDACAIIVQTDGHGPILGAVAIPLAGKGS